jgi:4-hydroxy-tetrahydrodipicolinate reductase
MSEIKLPKIAIVGYGSMGKEVDRIARDKGYIITDIFEINNPIQKDKDYDFDIAIDFSFPHTVVENVKLLSEMNKNVVLGTTGWYDKKNTIRELVGKAGIGLIYGSNFSIGMRMFFNIIENAARLVDRISDYDIFLHEIHHKRKKDSPSGTAQTLSGIILDNVNRKSSVVTDAIHGEINPEQLHVSSTRGGEVMGYHKVYMDSAADTIELAHRAKNRSGFAAGAISAASWIYEKKGFYEFGDMLENIWLA